MDLREIEWESVDWIHLAQDRDQWWTFANTVINLLAQWQVGNFFTRWATISFSKTPLWYSINVSKRSNCSFTSVVYIFIGDPNYFFQKTQINILHW